jgi:hypothetical protein
MKRAIATYAAAAALLAGSAHAATVVSTITSVPGYSNSLPATITFEEGPAGFVTADSALGYDWSGTGQLRSPPTTGDSAVPLGDTSRYYMSVLGGKQETLAFSPTKFPQGISALQVYLGSIDTYNSITFFSGGLSQVVDGTALLNSVAPGNVIHHGDQTSSLSNRFFTFVFNNNTDVNKVVFDSGLNSLEFDNVSASVGVGREGGGGVPEPAEWALLMSGFVLLVLAIRARLAGALG